MVSENTHHHNIFCFLLSTSKFWISKSLWLLQKFLLPLNKIPNTSSFVVKDIIIYIFLWGVINIWFQRNNVWCSSLNMRICIALFTMPLEPWVRHPVILEVTSVKVLVSFLRSKVQKGELWCTFWWKHHSHILLHGSVLH